MVISITIVPNLIIKATCWGFNKPFLCFPPLMATGTVGGACPSSCYPPFPVSDLDASMGANEGVGFLCVISSSD